MHAVNRITKTITIIFILLIVAAIGYAAWSIYVRIPRIREDIREKTASAVAKWFPTTDEGGFSYRTEVDLENGICRLKDLYISEGEGRILDNISFTSYELRAESIDLDLDSLLKDQRLKIIEIHGLRLEGDIDVADILSYFTHDNSGISDIRMEYDDFTEKTTITADIDEMKGIRVSIIGKWGIDEDGALALTGRRYRNPDGSVHGEVIDFIEEHTNITISFEVFAFTLGVVDFNYDGATLMVELERE